MKIIIGITQEPESTQEFIEQHHGKNGTMTQIGPFISKVDALNWLVYVKSSVGNFEEIIPEMQSGDEAIWYGIAYERSAVE